VDADLQRRVQRYGWDKAATYYEGYWAEQLKPAQDLLLEHAALRPGERVLEVACGTGLVTFRAAQAVGPAGRITATDISEAMVEAVRSEAVRRGVDGEFRRMDAERLEYPDAQFDVVLCALGLMYCPDPGKALGEMHRVLVPGGRAAVAVWGARRNCGWAEIFPIVERRVASDVCPLFFMLGTGDVLAESFIAAGFTNVRVDRLASTLQYESAEDAIGAAFVGGPVALAYSRFDADKRDGAHAEYLESIEAYRLGDGYEIPGEFVVVSGRTPSSGDAADVTT
jgi:ubiquinone/menaquinone biosynthesis C-methylase UbiE